MAMHEAGCVISLTQAGFDATELLDAIDAFGVASMARYKVPEVWQVTTDDLPRNAMGKLDRPAIAARLVGEQRRP
jgi:acyl-CoA synthetase (AMP-forming)/AMP-acid ligase II